jgi:hypothetical protein
MTAKFNADILGRLAEASADDLATALAAIREDFGGYRDQGTATPESASAIVALRDAAKAILGEQERRATAAGEAEGAMTELDGIFAEGDTTEAAQPAVEGEAASVQEAVNEQHGTGDADALANQDTGGETTDDADDTDGDDTTTEDDGADADDQEGEGAVTASAGRRKLGGINNQPAKVRKLETVKFTATASAGLTEFAPGATLTRKDMWKAFADKLRSVHNQPGYERYKVATVRAEFPESRHLTASGDAEANMERVEAVVDAARSVHATRNGFDESGRALVAAGFCAPLENLYDIRTIGDTERPVRDALVRFAADRGGIQYRPALDGVTQTGGIGFWDAADDEADPLVPKTCVEIACPGILTAEVEAIYQCLTFSNMSTRFDPEFMDSVIRAQSIAHARIAENRLLTLMTTASKRIFSTQLLGATRDILVVMDKVIAYYRNVHRLANETALRWIAPLWARYLMRADITRQMVGDGLQTLAVTDAAVDSWFRERNVNPTWHLDGIDPPDIPSPVVPVPAQFYTLLVADAPVPPFPDALSTLLFAEGDWLHLDGGTLDLGVVRDSTLNGQNRFQTFSESFEFPAFRGIESLHVVIPAEPTGASAATVTVSPAAA